ncbi:melatonin receptor type 1B isoform X2 [Pseudopipra pipra]|uniref:melatonin receptor type 1B isoform X2 n=1 Tax=Pseudopipra pipra TaxID=415032 RepID=UPI003139D6F4
MLENGSLRNCCDPGGRGRLGLAEREAAAAGAPRPAWVVPVLSSVLIFTTVVDILGNLLVILSVFKNRKLRNSAVPRSQACLWSPGGPSAKCVGPEPPPSVLALSCVQEPPQALNHPFQRTDHVLPSGRAPSCLARERGMLLMKHCVLSMELPRKGNRFHPLKIPETKRVPKAVGRKKGVFKTCSEVLKMRCCTCAGKQLSLQPCIRVHGTLSRNRLSSSPHFISFSQLCNK